MTLSSQHYTDREVQWWGLCATMMNTEEPTQCRVDTTLLPAGAHAVGLCPEIRLELVPSLRRQPAAGHFLQFPWKPGALYVELTEKVWSSLEGECVYFSSLSSFYSLNTTWGSPL